MGTTAAQTLQQQLAALAPADQLNVARILQQFVNADDEVQVITLQLGTAKDPNDPFPLGSFTSCYVENATDNLTTFNLRINSKGAAAGQIPMFKKDVWNRDYPCAQAFLDWPQQVGKTATLILFRTSHFQSGSQLSSISGGSTLSDGSTYTRVRTSLTGAGAVPLFPADSTAIKRTAFNTLGYDLYVGESSFVDDGTAGDSTIGLLWPNGTPLVSQNTGALYCYNPGATAKVTVLTEK